MQRPDASHIRQIHVVSNTHWDREFRRSLERTRRMLLEMLDVTLDILDRDPAYHSFTCDGHCILVEDYLEMRPERRPLVERLAREGRLLLGPWFTLPEVLSIGDEALVRNFLWAQKACRRLGTRPMPVGYTPASWGQTGQLPQIMASFGVDHPMFYRGISHHEAPAEFWWEAPDGTRLLASRFALYARYNWYYLVHRVVTTGKAFDKVYDWAAHDETPMRIADGLAGVDAAFRLLNPEDRYDRSKLAAAIEEMVRMEGPHFTTPHFLAMNGHDISVAFPRESEVIRDANEVQSRWPVRHTNLMEYWAQVEKSVDAEALPVLRGERRSALKEGMWTYLLPGSVSARTYLKQMDFETHNRLAGRAEPLAAMAASLGMEYPRAYLDRGWRFLLSNHTHDANGGCAPDRVCEDMEFRYRQAQDCADIAVEDAMAHVVRNLAPGKAGGEERAKEPEWRLVIFNPLPQARREIVEAEIELPASTRAKSLVIRDPQGRVRPYQIIEQGASGAFIDSIWEVPRISNTIRFHVLIDVEDIPPVGYTTLTIEPSQKVNRCLGTMARNNGRLANEFMILHVAGNGAIGIYEDKSHFNSMKLNLFRDQGEVGTAWFHSAPTFDEIISSEGCAAQLAVVQDGPLQATLRATITMELPAEAVGERSRSPRRIPHVIETFYTIRKGDPVISIRTVLDNQSRDHWLRVLFPLEFDTLERYSYADSHFDVVCRPVDVPCSSDWVEQAVGTHPLRTMVDVTQTPILDRVGKLSVFTNPKKNARRVAEQINKRGLSVFTKGLFEYEILNLDKSQAIAISLLRAMRIKLLVSEEKKQELPDQGPQCLGPQEFHYALYPHRGDWDQACSLAQARRWATPVRVVQAGRGHGTLPASHSLFSVNRQDVVVTAVKCAEEEPETAGTPTEKGNATASAPAIIVRMFNPTEEAREMRITWHRPPRSARLVRLDESPQPDAPGALAPPALDGREIVFTIPKKKILTLRVEE